MFDLIMSGNTIGERLFKIIFIVGIIAIIAKSVGGGKSHKGGGSKSTNSNTGE